MKSQTAIDLSVIILNYKSGEYLSKCLKSIYKSKLGKYNIEIIIVDNNSPDNSIALAKKNKSILNTYYLLLNTNKGFAYGNNRGVEKISNNSQNVLFLNPDTIVRKHTFYKCLKFLDKHPQSAAMTCKINLVKTGKLQPECHRGFPYPWRSFCYFTGLYKLAPNSAFLNGYFQGNLNLNKIHQIEACVGAFFLIRRKIGDNLKWWNEKYLFYGEDLQFCYDLQSNHYNLFFYPYTTIDHYQGVSSGLKSQTKNITTASRTTKIMVARASTNAMRIFYKENLLKNYNFITKSLVMVGINILEFYRVTKAKGVLPFSRGDSPAKRGRGV